MQSKKAKISQLPRSRRVFIKFLQASWPLLLLTILVCIFFYPVFQGKIPLPSDFVAGVYYPWLDYKWGYATGVPVKNPLTTDVVSFMYPMQMFAVDLLKSGQWPLWNPYILAGTPLLANFQSAPFSPTNFVYWLFSDLTGWSVQIILQHILAAVFTYILLRWWKVSKVSSIVGGLIFAFSGFNVIWSQWNGHALAAAFIPLLLLFEDRCLKKGKLLDGVALSFVLAFQIFSGYPQVVMYSAVAMVLLWFVRIFSILNKIKVTAMVAIFVCLGLGLSAPQLLPGSELMSLSQRAVEDHPYQWAFLPWSKIITFVAPDFFGNHATGNYWGPQDYTSNTGFVGVTAAVLIGYAAFSIRKKKEVLFCFMLLFIALSLSFPTPLSLLIWESKSFGLQAASAHRALVLFNLAAALLSAFGIDWLRGSKKSPGYFFPLVLPGMVLLMYGLYSLVQYVPVRDGLAIPQSIIELKSSPHRYLIGLRNLILPGGVFLGVCVTCLLFPKRFLAPFFLVLFVMESYYFGWKFTPFTPRIIAYPQTPVLEFMENQDPPFRVTGNKVIPMNMRMPYHLESPEGYDAVYSVTTAKFLSSLNDNSEESSFTGRYGSVDNLGSRLLDLMNTKYFLALKKDAEGRPSPDGSIPSMFQNNRFKLAFTDGSVAIMENKSTLPRASMYYRWEVVHNDKGALRTLLEPSYELGKSVVLASYPENLQQSGEQGEQNVEYSYYGTQSSVLTVSTSKPGILLVADSYFPGWSVYVDGVEKTILQADFAFRGVEIPEGKHTVRFVYWPQSFFYGLLIAGTSSGVVLIICLGILLGKGKNTLYTLKR